MLMERTLARDVEEVLQGMLPQSVACAVNDIAEATAQLYPVEETAIANAQPKRRQEFIAGRSAAREAFRALGAAAAPIPMAPDRSPVWPAGLCGSISHDQRIAAAIVARSSELRSLGLDIEDAAPLDTSVIDTICTPLERERLNSAGGSREAKAIFSAKEATYKALYPLTAKLLDFHDISVTFPAPGQFDACLCVSAAPFARGDVITGRQTIRAGCLVTVVTIGQGD